MGNNTTKQLAPAITTMVLLVTLDMARDMVAEQITRVAQKLAWISVLQND